MIYDMAMSFMMHLERNGFIIIDARTGELLKDLALAKWNRMAGDFADWVGELELASSVGQMQTEEELHAA